MNGLKRLCWALFSAAVAVVGCPTYAAVVDVSSAKIVVEGQGSSAQRAALRASLRQVFVKMTGSESVFENTRVRDLLRQPEDVLLSYRYETADDRQYYIAKFDEQKLLDILKQERLPIWGSRRVETVIWGAFEDNAGKRHIISDASTVDFAEQIALVAEQRGVPIVFPLMDLTDATVVNVADIWGQFTANIRQATQRYGTSNSMSFRVYPTPKVSLPDLGNTTAFSSETSQKTALDVTTADAVPPVLPDQNIIVELEGIGQERIIKDASLSKPVDDYESIQTAPEPLFSQREFEDYQASLSTAGAFSLDWQVHIDGTVTSGRLSGDSIDELVQKLMVMYADMLAQKYAIDNVNVTEKSRVYQLTIANMVSLQHYVAISSFLNEISLVENAELISIQNSVGTFEVRFVGDESDLTRSLSLDSSLVPVTDAFGRPLPGNHYYWKN